MMLPQARSPFLVTTAMRYGCFCLHPACDVSPGRQKGSHENGGSNGAAYEPQTVVQQPVRAVSPADVRRTASGRVIRHKADAGLRAIREASAGMHVLGGSTVTSDPLESRAEGARSSAEMQQHSVRPQARRVLQPVNGLVTACKQENPLLQFLRPSRKSLQPDSIEPARCKSIMEASQKRLQRYKQAPAALQMAIIQIFSDAYLFALSKGDQQWANAAEIAASFSPDAVLKTQDKRTFYGKPAVLKRLNSGAIAIAQN